MLHTAIAAGQAPGSAKYRATLSGHEMWTQFPTPEIVTPSFLRRRLKEASFLAGFCGAINATLEPRDVCATAATWLRGLFGSSLTVFSLAGESGSISYAFSADGSEVILDARRDSGSREKATYGPKAFPFTKPRYIRKERVVTFPLADEVGSLTIYPGKGLMSSFSGSFTDEIAEILSRALRNALKHDRMKNLSMRDPLTGLFNRRVLEEMLEIEGRKRDAAPVSLLLVDLDNFKSINDTYGHTAGDQAITAVAALLRDSSRGSDIVVRYGGEEFALLLPDTSEQAAMRIAERLRRKVEESIIQFDGTELKATVSIGAACCAVRHGRMMQELIGQADQALYRAKAAGKNQVCFSS